MDHKPILPGSEFTHFAYNPNVAANALYIAIFLICLVGQVVQGVRYKTWQFMGPMVVGILFELLGYIARILMHNDPSDRRWFMMDNITLILGPALLAAAIYLCMGHIVQLYGAYISSLKPRTYLILFVACDIVNLVVQTVGGVMCSTFKDPTGIQAGIDIVVAGLATQVASLVAFMACCMHFAYSVTRHSDRLLHCFQDVRESRTFRSFLFAIALAVACVFTRSMFRMIELRQGFVGPLANNEIYFMVLEGAMILIVTMALTVFHPGRCFKGCWEAETYSSVSERNETDLEIANLFEKKGVGSACSSVPPTRDSHRQSRDGPLRHNASII